MGNVAVGAVASKQKRAEFVDMRCPQCGNNMRAKKEDNVKFPEECPICNAGEEAPVIDRTIPTTDKEGARTIQRMASELARQSALIRRLESDVKLILATLGRESTALNGDEPKDGETSQR